MKISSLSAGMVVWDVGRQQMGNTRAGTAAVWRVYIQSVDLEKGVVVASWNGNLEREFREYEIKRWRKKRPVLIKSGFGYRLATRSELAQLAETKSRD